MFVINTNTYAKNCVHTIKVISKGNKSVLWIKMHNIQDKLGFKIMSDLTVKTTKDICNNETPSKGKKLN